MVVEIFLIPGFGITGVSGIVLIAASLVLSRQDFIWPSFEWEWDVFRRNLLTVGISVVSSIIAFGVIIRLFPHLPFFNRLILAAPADGKVARVTTDSLVDLTEGRRGYTVTPLRPVGKAEIEGVVYNVQTEGEFVDAGIDIEVVSIEGNRVLVRGG